jgi:SAM-dependent methyltransferase
MTSQAARSDAARRWAECLEAMAVPDEILAGAPESPHGFDVDFFARIADEAAEADTPSRQAALAALPEAGSGLDVGCGAGAAALPLTPPAAMLIGVDEDPEMLGAFGDRVDARGVAHAEIVGRWPDAAPRAPAADVVLCHTVVYNGADAVPFLTALTDHARRRVVVELTEQHPLAWMRPYWRALHDFDRPPGPEADDFLAVLAELGYDVEVARWERPSRGRRERDAQIDFLRRHLAVDTDRDDEIDALLDQHPPPETRRVVTVAWSPA